MCFNFYIYVNIIDILYFDYIFVFGTKINNELHEK